MKSDNITKDPLSFVWHHKFYDPDNLYTSCGKKIEVISGGYKSMHGPEFSDVEISIEGTTYKGSVAVHANSSDWYFDKRNQDPSYDNVILSLSGNCDRIIRMLDDSILFSASLKYPERISENIKAITGSSSVSPCIRFVRRYMEDIETKNGFSRLLVERLERKYDDVMKIYSSVGESWQDTFHILFSRTMGLGSNKDIYMSLARNIPYSILCRERGDIKRIEAMIFGTAGLLDDKLYDEYKAELGAIYSEMAEKHDLQILEYCKWTEKGVRPYNFAPKRLAQISKVIETGNATFDNIIIANNIREVKKMFDMELSHYWKRSFDFGKRAPMAVKGIGDMTLDIIIINLVAPILFAYGRQTGNVELEERALEYLYDTTAEMNRYTKPWEKESNIVENAFFSQALIQLSTEYCDPRKCTECFIGIKAIKPI
ncbi:MAG: DUF2851 family protein [Rikenellaceae bacterium]|nr:DUF2851 family protein [Rikenellaceae bacterium]